MDVINEMLVAKATAGKRSRYLIELRHSLKLFADGRLIRPIDSFTPQELESYVNRPAWAPATRRSYLIDLRTLFNFAIKRGYLHQSPTAGVEWPVLDAAPPEIHTPDQAAAMLATAQRDPDVMRILAIQYFGGLRVNEAMQLVD